MIEMVLNTLPKIAAEIAAPLCNVERIKIVSGEGGEIGIARLTGSFSLWIIAHLMADCSQARWCRL